MKKILLLCSCLFATITLLAQHKHSLEIMASPDFSYRRLSSDNPADDFLIQIRSSEQSAIYYRLGIAYVAAITPRFSTKIGAQFANMGYKSRKTTGLQWPSENQNGTWVPDPTLPHEQQFIYQYRYLSLPVLLRYQQPSTRRISWYLEGGLSFNAYLDTKEISKTDIGRTSINGRTDQFENINYGFNAGFGASYRLTEHWALFAQPTFRYFFTSLIANSTLNEYLYSGGLEVGMKRTW
jgi:Outer membrane protein beta-barrel domain